MPTDVPLRTDLRLGEGFAFFRWVGQWWRAAKNSDVRQCRKEWDRGER